MNFYGDCNFCTDTDKSISLKTVKYHVNRNDGAKKVYFYLLCQECLDNIHKNPAMKNIHNLQKTDSSPLYPYDCTK